MHSLLAHRHAIPALLLLGGLGPLAVALAAQYLGGLHPCHFCLLQRYPYVFVAFCGAAAFALPARGVGQRLLVALALMGWLTTALLALVHSGIERGLLAYKGGCVAAAAADTSLEALRAQIAGAPIVACNDVPAVFLGLSMAGWNFLGACALMVLTVRRYRCERRDAT